MKIKIILIIIITASILPAPGQSMPDIFVLRPSVYASNTIAAINSTIPYANNPETQYKFNLGSQLFLKTGDTISLSIKISASDRFLFQLYFMDSIFAGINSTNNWGWKFRNNIYSFHYDNDRTYYNIQQTVFLPEPIPKSIDSTSASDIDGKVVGRPTWFEYEIVNGENHNISLSVSATMNVYSYRYPQNSPEQDFSLTLKDLPFQQLDYAAAPGDSNNYKILSWVLPLPIEFLRKNIERIDVLFDYDLTFGSSLFTTPQMKINVAGKSMSEKLAVEKALQWVNMSLQKDFERYTTFYVGFEVVDSGSIRPIELRINYHKQANLSEQFSEVLSWDYVAAFGLILSWSTYLYMGKKRLKATNWI